MASHPTTHPDQHSDNNEYDRHTKLYSRRPELKDGAERRERTIGREAKVNFLQTHYRKEFGLTEQDLRFIECLGHLEVNGGTHITDRSGNRLTRNHYLTEGHRWVVDYFDPDLKLLEDLGLIQQPYIDGKSRERIIRRRFWDLTSSGRDLVDIDFAGEHIGDTGEHVVHRLGQHMTRWWCEAQWEERELLDIEPYPTIQGEQMDLAVWNEGGYQYINGEDVDRYVRHVFEIETGVSDVSGDLETDAIKMAHQRGDSWWVFPNRKVLAKVLDELTLRGYTGLSSPIPKTLAVRNHRDTYNKRLADAESEQMRLPYSGVDRVMTYKQLVDDLKEWRPELFYGAKDVEQ